MNYLSTSTLVAELTILFKVILFLSFNLLRKKESHVASQTHRFTSLSQIY